MFGSFLLIRGIVSIIVGTLAFVWPGLTIAVLVGLFGAYALLDGITLLVLGLKRKPLHGRAWALVLEGLTGVAAGVLTFAWPGATALVLVWLIGAWAIVTGLLEIAAAVWLRRVLTGEWLIAASGVLSVVFGLLVLIFPEAGAVGIAWALGSYAMAAGVILVALGIRLRSRVIVMHARVA